MTTRALICGSRTWADPFSIAQIVRGLPSDGVVITGMAGGADALAYRCARLAHREVEPHHADWGRYGKGAGPMRNQRMLDEGKPTVVWAFIDKPLEESRGTADMVRRAKAAGVPVYVVSKG